MSPAPAVVRPVSKGGRNPSNATPATNASAMAIKGVASPMSKRQSGLPAHPYATGGPSGFDRAESDGFGGGGYRSGQAAPQPQMSSSAPQGGIGLSNDDYQDDEPPRAFSLIRFLTCRCG